MNSKTYYERCAAIGVNMPPLVYRASGVYALVCDVNQKMYIGCSKSMLYRIATHVNNLRRGAHSNPHLQAAWAKHGPKNFHVSIIQYANQNFFEEEKYWIEAFDSYRNGYNRTPGGEGVSSDSPEVCAKRVATFKRNYTEERRQSASERARAQMLALSPEERSARAKARSDLAKKAYAELSPEDKELRSKKLGIGFSNRWAGLDAEARSVALKAMQASRSAEARAASAKKAWETRRKNKV